jgi:hypothetical protein
MTLVLSRKWEDNILMNLKKTGYDGTNFIHLAENKEDWRNVAVCVAILRL